MIRPRLLDLFCGAGGAAMGYHRAGFDVIGVDIEPQPRYPFEFWQHDAIDLLDKLLSGRWMFGVYRPLGIEDFDVIHASPPCQAYSDLAARNGNGSKWPRLIELLRELLTATSKPWVIENVEGAPLINPVRLCGVMFPPLRVIRHRLFESNVPLLVPVHAFRHPLVFTYDRRKAHYGRLDQSTAFVQVTGGGNATVANKRAAMGIDWMTGREINEAIPPAYTEFIGEQLLAHLELEGARIVSVADIATERCPAYYDGDGPSRGTHTCNRTVQHDGPHYCVVCGSTWTRKGAKVTQIFQPSNPERPHLHAVKETS